MEDKNRSIFCILPMLLFLILTDNLVHLVFGHNSISSTNDYKLEGSPLSRRHEFGGRMGLHAMARSLTWIYKFLAQLLGLAR